MVLLTRLSLAGSLVLTASFAEEPSSKSVPTYRVVAGWPEASSPITRGPVWAMATAVSDRVFVFHRGEPPAVVFDRGGKYLRSWGEGLVTKAHGLRIDREPHVWTTDVGHQMVRKFDHEGNLLLTLGRQGMPGAGPDRFNPPTDVAMTPLRRVLRRRPPRQFAVRAVLEGGPLPEGVGHEGQGRVPVPPAARLRPRPGKTAGSTWATARTSVSSCSTPRPSSSPSGWRGGAPCGRFLTADRRLLVASGVTVLDVSGKAFPQRGEPGAGFGRFAIPHAVCVDSLGDVNVTKINGQRLQKFSAR